MSDIANQIQYAKDKPPNSCFIESLCYLLNYVDKRQHTALLAAVVAATTVAGLADAIDGLAMYGNDEGFKRHLANHIRVAGAKGMLDDADVVAFTTINGGGAVTTDMVYGLCTQHDPRLTATWGELDGQHFHPFLPAEASV